MKRKAQWNEKAVLFYLLSYSGLAGMARNFSVCEGTNIKHVLRPKDPEDNFYHKLYGRIFLIEMPDTQTDQTILKCARDITLRIQRNDGITIFTVK